MLTRYKILWNIAQITLIVFAFVGYAFRQHLTDAMLIVIGIFLIVVALMLSITHIKVTREMGLSSHYKPLRVLFIQVFGLLQFALCMHIVGLLISLKAVEILNFSACFTFISLWVVLTIIYWFTTKPNPQSKTI